VKVENERTKDGKLGNENSIACVSILIYFSFFLILQQIHIQPEKKAFPSRKGEMLRAFDVFILIGCLR